MLFTQASAFWGLEHSILTSSPCRTLTPKNPLWGAYNGKLMGTTYLHNCMMYRDTMLKYSRLFDLAKYLDIHKSFSVRGMAGG